MINPSPPKQSLINNYGLSKGLAQSKSLSSVGARTSQARIRSFKKTNADAHTLLSHTPSVHEQRQTAVFNRLSAERRMQQESSIFQAATFSKYRSLLRGGMMSVILSPLDKAAFTSEVQSASRRVMQHFCLSTTGYIAASSRENSTRENIVSAERAKGYSFSASRFFSNKNTLLKELTTLQGSQINMTEDGQLSSPIDMSVQELSDCVRKCDIYNFANCDIQSMRIANELHHRLGVSLGDMSLCSNHKLSHNYLVIKPSANFPKGVLIDPWAGVEFQDFGIFVRRRYKHTEEYMNKGTITENATMLKWIAEEGEHFLLP